MTILVLGGRGTTSSRVSSLLSAAKVPFLIASRSSDPNTPYIQAKFDWLDEKTFGSPFETALSNGLAPISGVYVVAPPILDMVPPMKAFVDFAREKGVKRFVLLSASTFEMGGAAMGKVHEYLASFAGVEWAALRPTWFMENFSEGLQHAAIKKEDKIRSATGDGKIPFVSADDIARVAYRALTDEKPHNTDHVILGPGLLTYDEVADIFTSVLGRKITHVKMDQSEFVDTLMEETGMPRNYAEMMGQLDTDIKNGSEARLNDDVEKVTGKAPRKFKDFAVQMKDCWI